MTVWYDPFGVREFGEKVFGCLCCLACSGPILLLIGIIMLGSSFTDTRKGLVDQYNSAVDEWINGNYLSELKELNGLVSVQLPEIDMTPMPYSFDDGKDELDDGHPEQLHNYGNYGKFTSHGPFGSKGEGYVSNDISLEAYIAVNDVQLKQEGFEFPYITRYEVSVSCDRSRGDSCMDQCTRGGGRWTTLDPYSGTCYNYRIANSMCIRVGKSSEGAWEFKGSCLSNENSYTTSHRLNYHAFYSVKDLYFVIRHEKDPYVTAAKLTNDEYSFGMTPGDKRVTGLALLVIGCLFTAVPILGCIIIIKCMKPKQEQPLLTTTQVVQTTGMAPQYQYQPLYQPPVYQQPMYQQPMQPGQQIIYNPQPGYIQPPVAR